MVEKKAFKMCDELDVRNKSELKGFFEDEEQVFFSGIVDKINKYKVIQERIIIITNKYLYNISPTEGLLKSIAHRLMPKMSLKRKISTKKLSGATMSVHPMSNEFIIHVEGEYDYRYDGVGKRDQIITSICHAYFAAGGDLFSLYLKNKKDLAEYHTTDDDWKVKNIKRPSRGKIIVTSPLLDKGLKFIIENKANFMSQEDNDQLNLGRQSEKIGKSTESFEPPRNMTDTSLAIEPTFLREKPIRSIDDIPMTTSGVMPKRIPSNQEERDPMSQVLYPKEKK
jgi:hypothetical protein